MNQCENESTSSENELGKVVMTEGSYVFIERLHLSGCKSCSMHGLCGAKENPKLKFKDNQGLKVGDIVEIKMNPNFRIFTSFLVFIFPIIMLFIFLLFGLYIGLPEKKAIILGFLGLLISAIIIWFIDKYVSKGNRITLTKIDETEISRNMRDSHEDTSE